MAELQEKYVFPKELFLLLFCLFPFCYYYTAITFFIVFAHIPTFVAAIVDKDPQKFLTFSVFNLNLATSIPYGLRLLALGGDWNHSWHLLLSHSTWLILFMACGIGWGLHLGIPKAAQIVLQNSSRRQLKEIQKKKDELCSFWGDGVKDLVQSPSPDEPIQ